MNIVFIVVCQFPYGSASSMRARGIYRLLELAGHKVHVISDNESDKSQDCFQEFSCEGVLGSPSFRTRRQAPKKSMEALGKYCDTHKVDAVLTNARYDRITKLSKFCKKRNIKLLIENCEWYDVGGFRLKFLDTRFWKNEKMIRHDFKNADGFISISRLLDEHNKKFAPSVRIPTILDVENTEFKEATDNEKIKIVYTGNPGKNKEFLAPVCRVLAENDELKKNFEFHIYGPSRELVLANVGSADVINKAGESVIIHGRVPQKEIEGVLKSADYLIFLRPQRRSSDAGFPTKLGESFSVGTPVISNDTGDLSLYIKTGENGYLLDSASDEELRKALSEILAKTDEDYKKMRKNARKTAEECFDYRRYTQEIEEIF